MKNRKLIAITGIILILSVLVSFKFFKKEEDIHYHSGFVVFKDGQKVDFSDFKYMNIEPCTAHKEDKKETPEHEQIEKAHLHGQVGDVVHVHRSGAVWKDLFTNINYPVDYASVSAYINGNKVDGIASKAINAYDSVILFIGNVDEQKLSLGVSQEHIEEVEQKSAECGN